MLRSLRSCTGKSTLRCTASEGATDLLQLIHRIINAANNLSALSQYSTSLFPFFRGGRLCLAQSPKLD
eukprot:SAG31_NODE_967_length_10684_cov_58.582239_3_plen_68_part_00